MILTSIEAPFSAIAFLCLTDFLGTDAFIRKAVHLAFASAAIVQTISTIAVLKGKPLEAVIDFGVVFIVRSLQSHHLSDNAVAHLDRANENEHIKEQFAYITPHLRDRRRIGIDHGW